VAAPLIFCIKKDVVQHLRTVQIAVCCAAVHCQSWLGLGIDFWYYRTSLAHEICITGVLTATGLRACVFVCLFVCLSVCMLLLLERRGVAFYELRFKISSVICQCKGTKCRMTNPLGKMLGYRQNFALYFALSLWCIVTRLVCCQPGSSPKIFVVFLRILHTHAVTGNTTATLS
jgi:hypothetical protein